METYKALACCALLITLVHPVNADSLASRFRDENGIWLTGPFLDQTNLVNPLLGPVETGDHSMVCGMKHRTSTLAIRAQPAVTAEPVAQAPYYAILVLTGEVTNDLQWARASSILVQFTTDARKLDEQEHTRQTIDGWVSTRYLCSFVDY